MQDFASPSSKDGINRVYSNNIITIPRTPTPKT